MILAASTSPVLVFFALLGTCVWVGGFVAIVVATRSVRRTVEPPSQIAFFRSFGRSYGIVGNIALLIALGCGAALLTEHAWDATALAAVVLAAVLVLSTVAGVVQARGMTRLRRAAVQHPEDATLASRVHRGARLAGTLRALIGLLSIALLALASALVS